MKHKLLTITMIIAGLLFPLEINAKGKPASVALLKDANGVEIGRVIGMPYVARPYVLTDKGYRTQILVTNGKLQLSHTIVFESTNCTGAAYIIGPGGFVGTVFSPTTNIDMAYTLGVLF